MSNEPMFSQEERDKLDKAMDAIFREVHVPIEHQYFFKGDNPSVNFTGGFIHFVVTSVVASEMYILEVNPLGVNEAGPPPQYLTFDELCDRLLNVLTVENITEILENLEEMRNVRAQSGNDGRSSGGGCST